MSLQLVKEEVIRFLTTGGSEAICLRGHWGVGKTFAWNKYLKDCQQQLALPKYSYVSLFGVSSLEELRYAIFENAVSDKDIGIEPGLDTLKSNTAGVMKQLGKKSIPFLLQLPKIKGFIGTLGPIWFLSVRNMVVCIDDIERRGKGLAVRDVLGLVSALKERRGCKVCLVLNDEVLDAEKEDFDAYLEKVIDTSLSFAPTAVEAAEIALSPTGTVSRLVRESCIKLGISNIRLIKRIERVAQRFEELVKGLDEQVLIQAIPSLTALGWSVYDRKRAPSVEFLRKRGSVANLIRPKKAEPLPPQEAAWNALLDAYRWSGLDEFDEVLLDGIRNGYFDPAGVAKYAQQIDARAKATKSTGRFEASWQLYRDSFADNQKEVLDEMFEGLREAVPHISPGHLNAAVSVLNELGRTQQAEEAIKLYVEAHSGDAALFDLERTVLAGTVDQPKVIEAFKQKAASLAQAVDAESVLLSMVGRNGWSPEDLTTLAAIPVDGYYAIFKKYSGNQLHDILKVCFQFGGIDNVTPEMKEIVDRSKQALARIGVESPLNAMRVRKYGVDV